MITDPWTVPESSRLRLAPAAEAAEATATPAAAAAAASANNSPTATTNTQQPSVAAEFEDNFQPLAGDPSVAQSTRNVLPDSAEYLASLERKLHRLRTAPGVLQQLQARREHCVERLLRGQIDLPSAAELGYDPLDAATSPPDSVVGDLRRHLRPEQALCEAELLHLLRYDQLRSQSPADASAAAAAAATSGSDAESGSDSLSR